MKKSSLILMAILATVSCSKEIGNSAFNDETSAAEDIRTAYIEIGVTEGDDTDESKATYDKSLNFTWEAGDQLLAVFGQACVWKAATNMNVTIEANSLNLGKGAGENLGTFSGDISIVGSSDRYFHFAYPVNQTSLSTHGEIGAWNINSDGTQTTTCTYTIASEQDGKWQPFLCASTGAKTSADNIGSVSLGTSRNACFAIRVFSYAKAPKQAAEITIIADQNIIGSMTATTANDGSFADATFTATATGNTITGSNLTSIGKVGNYYEYRFEVLPDVTVSKFRIQISDTEGGYIERNISRETTFRANTMTGINIQWDAADVQMDATSWWEEQAKDGAYANASASDGGKIYVSRFAVTGLGADDTITSQYITLTDTNGDSRNITAAELTAMGGVISVSPANGTWGEYVLAPHAEVVIGGETKLIDGQTQTIVVSAGKPEAAIQSHTIRSSYNSNSSVAKDNGIDGDKIYATVTVPASLPLDLVESMMLNCDGAEYSFAPNTEFNTGTIPSKQYADCYAVLRLKVGNSVKESQRRVIATPHYEMNVTGIPYYFVNNSSGQQVKGGNNGASISGQTNIFAPGESMTVNVVYNVVLDGRSAGTTGKLTVGGTTIFEQKSASGFANTKTTTVNGSKELSLTTSTVDYTYSNSYGLGASASYVYEISLKY